MKKVIIVIGILAATCCAYLLHVLISGQTQPIIGQAMQGIQVMQPPYPLGIKIMGGLTAIIPVLASYFILSWCYLRLPGRSPWSKGIIFGVFILLLKGALIRIPLMGVCIGNPIWIVALQQLDQWLANIAMSIILAYTVHLSFKNK